MNNYIYIYMSCTIISMTIWSIFNSNKEVVSTIIIALEIIVKVRTDHKTIAKTSFVRWIDRNTSHKHIANKYKEILTSQTNTKKYTHRKQF